MAKQLIEAKVTINGEVYSAERESDMYDANSELTQDLINDANQGRTLKVQASIRNAIKVKMGVAKKGSAEGTAQKVEID